MDAIGAELDVNPDFGVNIIPVKAWLVDSEMTIKNKGYNFILALFFFKICINLIQVNFRLKCHILFLVLFWRCVSITSVAGGTNVF